MNVGGQSVGAAHECERAADDIEHFIARLNAGKSGGGGGAGCFGWVVEAPASARVMMMRRAWVLIDLCFGTAFWY